MASVPVRPGDVLGGKYRVERLIGSGGIGVVAQATHLLLGRQVALKLVRSDLSDRAEVVARLAREARAAARLRGEHVSRILDVGELEGGTPFLVMEYLEGSDFRALLGEAGRLGIGDALDYVLQACEAVAEAHAAGIVHRDLKPANLFLTRGPDGAPLVKVLDFGISKALGPGQPVSLTSSASLVGTPLYMSPEQLKNAREVDVRTDLWALGAILYEFLAGRPPFVARSLPELCVMLDQQEPVSLCLLRPEVPAELAAVVARCLRKRRTERYGSVAELARALAPHASSTARLRVERIARLSGRSPAEPIDVDARPAPPSDTGGGTAAITPASAEPSLRSARQPIRIGRLVVGVAVLVMSGAAAALCLGGLRPSLVSSAEPSPSRTEPEQPGSSPARLAALPGPLVLPAPSTSVFVASIGHKTSGRVAPSPALSMPPQMPSALAAPSTHGPDRLLTDRE
jgi:eukaryotic-like serine/threonine-protein kinase